MDQAALNTKDQELREKIDELTAARERIRHHRRESEMRSQASSSWQELPSAMGVDSGGAGSINSSSLAGFSMTARLEIETDIRRLRDRVLGLEALLRVLPQEFAFDADQALRHLVLAARREER